MKNIVIWTAIALSALVLSFADFAWPGDRVNCYQYLTQEDIFEDSETVFWFMKVDQFVIDNPTDMVLVSFGGCLYDLIRSLELHGKTAFIELVNDGWIPSRTKLIDRNTARAMADQDIADAEYSFDMEEDAYMRLGYHMERDGD